MASIIHLGTEQLKCELERLERAHGMSSAEFFARFQAGTMPEGPGFMRWAWLCTVAIRRGLLSVLPVHA